MFEWIDQPDRINPSSLTRRIELYGSLFDYDVWSSSSSPKRSHLQNLRIKPLLKSINHGVALNCLYASIKRSYAAPPPIEMLKSMTKSGTWIEICRFSQIIAKNHLQEATTLLCLRKGILAAAKDGSEDSFSGIERSYGHWNSCSPFQNVSQTEKINTSWLSGCVLWGVPGIAKTDISNHGSSSIFDEIQHDPIDQEKPESRRRNTAPNQQ